MGTFMDRLQKPGYRTREPEMDRERRRKTIICCGRSTSLRKRQDSSRRSSTRARTGRKSLRTP